MSERYFKKTHNYSNYDSTIKNQNAIAKIADYFKENLIRPPNQLLY